MFLLFDRFDILTEKKMWATETNSVNTILTCKCVHVKIAKNGNKINEVNKQFAVLVL